MAYDLKLTHASQRLGRAISAASPTISQEGAILCAVIEDGVEKVTLVAAPAGTEKVIGFSTLADALPASTAGCELVTVPTAPAALEVDLRANNLMVNRIRAYDKTASVNLTIDPVFAGVPAPGSVKVDLVQGRLKFAAGQAGASVQVNYLYELTTSQAIQLFGQRFINNQNLESTYAFTEVACGLGELYTDQFDPAQDYSSAAALTLGANGIVTKGGAGPALAAVVVNVPSVANPMLGIRFKFTA